jgi:hypothetical protein
MRTLQSDANENNHAILFSTATAVALPGASNTTQQRQLD